MHIDYDAHIMLAIEKAKAQQFAQDLYTHLIDQYKFKNNQDLKFLADMPYDQGRAYVDKTFADFMMLHESDPKRHPMQSPADVIKTMRAYRKKQNQLKRTTGKPQALTRGQAIKLACLGMDETQFLVREWNMDGAVLQNRDTEEILEIEFPE